MCSRTLRIFIYCFESQIAKLAFERNLPILPFCPILIRGDLFLATVPRMPGALLIDWKTGYGTKVELVDQEVRVACIQSYYDV